MSTPKSAPGDNGWERSAAPWIQLMEVGDPNRVLLLDEVMLKLCGDVQGRDVLDVGCGEGRFCRMLGARGARTHGVDPTSSLIAAARTKDRIGLYTEAVGEALPLPAASFDLVVSYVALVDIPDFANAIKEMARVLRPGGCCVVANLNGFNTASNRFWVRDDDGNKLYWTMDNYMSERAVRAEWKGVSIVNWHRPLSFYMKAFLAAGFQLEAFDEPVPTPDAVKKNPSMMSLYRIPHFCVMKWRR